MWLQKLDGWFASQNIHRISLAVKRKNEYKHNEFSCIGPAINNGVASIPQTTTNSGLHRNMPDPILS
jgi:hypothetical protein